MGFGEDIAALGQQFHQAASQLAVQRAVAGATEQVNQIKSAEGDEIQKQQQLRQVSEALTRDLAQFGAPADRIALIANSIAKPVPMYQSAQEALVNEKPGTDKYNAAQEYVKQDHAFHLQEAQIKANLAAKQSAQDKTYLQTTQMLETARGNPAVQQAEKDVYSAMKAESLAKLYNDPNKLSSPQVQLLATEVAKMASGGVPSIHELQGLDPKTLPRSLSELASKAVNKPTPANSGAFVQAFMDYAGALKKDAQGVIEDRYGRIIDARKKMLGAENYATLQDHYIGRFKRLPAVAAPGSSGTTASTPAPNSFFKPIGQ